MDELCHGVQNTPEDSGRNVMAEPVFVFVYKVNESLDSEKIHFSAEAHLRLAAS